MRSLGLQGIRRSKGVRTTIPAKDGKRAGDLLDRDFTAAAPSRTWVMDFTYVRTWAGFVYTAFILDLFAQKIVAWNVGSTKTVEPFRRPVADGAVAAWSRGPPSRARRTHRTRPRRVAMHIGDLHSASSTKASVPRSGLLPTYDNALMECVIGLYKTECIGTTIFHSGPYRTISDVEYATAGWVDWYKNRRLHSTLGMMTPVEFEQAHYAGPQPRAGTRIGAAENLGRFTLCWAAGSNRYLTNTRRAKPASGRSRIHRW